MHIAIIMDGNRRWAKENNLPKLLGHKKGIENVENIILWASELGLETLTLYALSTENLQREKDELKNIFDLMTNFAIKNKNKFIKENIRLKILGEVSKIRDDSKKALLDLEEYTKDCNKILLQICIAYGGRNEIVRSVKKLQEKNEKITEENISKNLDSNLEPDLIIRTGGNKRLSNFLLWQSSYSEIYFTNKFWPDFNKQDLEEAMNFFDDQQRNFGK